MSGYWHRLINAYKETTMKLFTPVLGACLLASSLALGLPATASADDLRQVSAPGEWSYNFV